jgi:cytochrome c-type biogenesis protein
VAVLADQVADGALAVAAGIAFVAGVLSFLSPCVLPLVPAYLSFVTGLSASDLATVPAPPARLAVSAGGPVAPAEPLVAAGSGEGSGDQRAVPAGVRRRVVIGSLGFVLGTAVVFVSFGALFGSFGQALRTHAVGLSQIFGVVTILLGLLLAGAFERFGRLDAALQRDVRIHDVPGRGLAAAPLLGFTFALGWTPCIGPTLGTVLGLSASTDGTTAARGALLSVAYCLGLGLPLLVTGLAFTRAMGAFAVVKRHYRAVTVAGGASLVLLGTLQVTGVWATWTNELQTRFGGWDLPL